MRISAEKINWRVALGELFLIVVGILMALAIDSYAERRADLAQADAYAADLVTELQADATHIASSYKRIGRMIDSASRLLALLQGNGDIAEDPGNLLLASLFGEGIMRQPAIWEEIQMTGALRLIPSPQIRSAIVSHYLGRAIQTRTIDENFVPAVRALRAVAWDIMPLESFPRFMQSGQSGVSQADIMSKLQSRNDTLYLLKRLIVTGSVARRNLQMASSEAAELLTRLGVPSEPSIPAGEPGQPAD